MCKVCCRTDKTGWKRAREGCAKTLLIRLGCPNLAEHACEHARTKTPPSPGESGGAHPPYRGLLPVVLRNLTERTGVLVLLVLLSEQRLRVFQVLLAHVQPVVSVHRVLARTPKRAFRSLDLGGLGGGSGGGGHVFVPPGTSVARYLPCLYLVRYTTAKRITTRMIKIVRYFLLDEHVCAGQRVEKFFKMPRFRRVARSKREH